VSSLEDSNKSIVLPMDIADCYDTRPRRMREAVERYRQSEQQQSSQKLPHH
jgi:hypothetical protein